MVLDKVWYRTKFFLFINIGHRFFIENDIFELSMSLIRVQIFFLLLKICQNCQ